MSNKEKTQGLGNTPVFAEPAEVPWSTQKPDMCQGHSWKRKWCRSNLTVHVGRLSKDTCNDVTKERLSLLKPNGGCKGLAPIASPTFLASGGVPLKHCKVAPTTPKCSTNRGSEVEFLACLHWFACLHQWQHQFLHFRHPFVSPLLIWTSVIVRLLLGAGIRRGRRHFRTHLQFTRSTRGVDSNAGWYSCLCQPWYHKVYRQGRRHKGTRAMSLTTKPSISYWRHPCHAEIAEASPFKLCIYVAILRLGNATATNRTWRRHASLPWWLRVLWEVVCFQLTGKRLTHHVYN